jgi:hypothetical protein
MKKQIDEFRASEAFAIMREPTILMNETDLKNWIGEIAKEIPNFKAGATDLKYDGMPVETRPEIRAGLWYIYDAFKY